MRAKTQNKFVRIITIPIKALCKARDFYVRSMTGCAGSMSFGSMDPAAHFGSALPRSFSGSSSMSNDNDDFRELVRAASACTFGNRIDMDMLLKQQVISNKGLPKSCSVGMSRIDEDKACDFGEDGVVDGKPNLLFPRSKTFAFVKKNALLSD